MELHFIIKHAATLALGIAIAGSLGCTGEPTPVEPEVDTPHVAAPDLEAVAPSTISPADAASHRAEAPSAENTATDSTSGEEDTATNSAASAEPTATESDPDEPSFDWADCTVGESHSSLNAAVADGNCGAIRLPAGAEYPLAYGTALKRTVTIQGDDQTAVIRPDHSTPSSNELISVYGNGWVTLRSLTIRDVNTEVRGGAIRTSPSGNVLLTLDGVRFENNHASYGGALDVAGGRVDIVGGCAFIGNSAENFGGAINAWVEEPTEIHIEDALFEGNTSGPTLARGGAIFAKGAIELQIVRSRFVMNSSDGMGGSKGGAAYFSNETNVDIIETSFEQNRATDGYHFGAGGAIYMGQADVRIRRSLFVGNEASGGQGRGGAIYLRCTSAEAELYVVNSTLHGNAAYGINTAYGGAIVTDPDFPCAASVGVYSSTITENWVVAPDPRGSAIYETGVTPVEIANTIIFANHADDATVLECHGMQIVSLGFNLSTNGCGHPGPGDIIGQDPALGGLENHGGSTDVLATTEIGAGVNRGNPLGCVDPVDQELLSTDQLGADRHRGGRCDIGAFELP